ALRRRSGRARSQRSRPNPRRLRLHQGLPGRKILSRRKPLHHRRGHQRNPASRHRSPDSRQEIIATCARIIPGRMTVSVENWAEQVRAGDVRAISRAVSAIENRSSEAEEILRQVFPYTGNAYLVGITGAPGTGKSTLVDRMAGHYRGEEKTVGIIAVDPSSPFTGGAILGDRVRMQRHATDSGIFIRSMATRGYLGGLAQATGDTALLLDAAGKQMILVETVGVGQGEIQIGRRAAFTSRARG